MKIELNNNIGVALQGDIAAIELDYIFQFFDYASISGEMRVIGEQNNASFFFQKGMLIFGALSFNQKKIGDLLIESNLITAAQLSQCLDIHARYQRRRRIGEIIVKKGFLDFERLAEMLKIQAREAFFTTLSWKKGMFYFYADQYPSKEEILINDRIDHLLLEGIVRMDNSTSADPLQKS